MATVAICLAEGFEEFEAVTVIDMLRRAGADLSIVGVTGAQVTGAHRIKIATDLTLKKAADKEWDLIVLPGGEPGCTNLQESKELKAWVEAHVEAKKVVAAICAAPAVLARWGLLKGKMVTCYPSSKADLAKHGAHYVGDYVVRDGQFITSRGPGTSVEFAMRLISDFISKEACNQLVSDMLLSEYI
jgi:4-methyl-5(b-hydroxyethyl)-thiazole monophosphate biosynthesis